PMIAIMLQSLLVFSFVKVFERKQIGYKILSIASLSFGWRALFIANIAINHALTGFPFSQLVSSQATLSFIFLYGLMETGILFVAFLAKLGLKRKVNLEFESHWLLSFSMLLAALIVVVMPLI
ncbi:MAG TPA: hypothetical protein DCX17_03625, partial [Firmicutes bacterium]|nr:hypothetical protein [Bacillota bacterium]